MESYFNELKIEAVSSGLNKEIEEQFLKGRHRTFGSTNLLASLDLYL